MENSSRALLETTPVLHSTVVASAQSPLLSAARRRVLGWASLVLTLIGTAAFALVAGQDGNGDQRAFHVPAVWLFLHPHQDPAWGVGGLAGLTPSTWNVPWYLLTMSAPAWVVVAYLGALHGVAVWLSGAVSWTVLKAAPRTWRLLLTVVVTLVSFAAPATLTEFGTTFGNLTTAIPVLGALLIYLRHPPGQISQRRALTVGLLLGVAFGLKFTNAMAVIAFVTAMLAREPFDSRTVRRNVAMILGILAGALASGGYWAVLMWDRFGNPLFPYYNGLFHSPYGATNNIHDAHYSTGWPWPALTLPFRMLSISGYPSEWHGRDGRWAAIVVLAVAAGVFLAQRRIRHLPAQPDACFISGGDRRFILIFTLVGWVVWLAQFSVARYLVVLELLSGLAALALIDLMLRSPIRKALAIALVGVVVLQYFITPGWIRKDPGGQWFGFAVPPVARQDHLLAVFPGTIMFDFALAALPDGATATKLPVAYNEHNPGVVHGQRREDRDIRRSVEGHAGPVVSITAQNEVNKAAYVADTYGFQLVKNRCQTLKTKFGDAAVCPWERSAPEPR